MRGGGLLFFINLVESCGITDPSALRAPPLTSGRILGFLQSLVVPNWKSNRERLTKLSPEVRGTSDEGAEGVCYFFINLVESRDITELRSFTESCGITDPSALWAPPLTSGRIFI